MREVASLCDMLEDLAATGSTAPLPHSESEEAGQAASRSRCHDEPAARRRPDNGGASLPPLRRGSSKADFERQLLQQQIAFFVDRIQRARRPSAPPSSSGGSFGTGTMAAGLSGGGSGSALVTRPSTSAGRPPSATVPAHALPPARPSTAARERGGSRPTSAATSASLHSQSSGCGSAAAEVIEGVKDNLSVFSIDSVLDTLKHALADEKAELLDDIAWLQQQLEESTVGPANAAAGRASAAAIMPADADVSCGRASAGAGVAGDSRDGGEIDDDGADEFEESELAHMRAMKHQLQHEYLALEQAGAASVASSAPPEGKPLGPSRSTSSSNWDAQTGSDQPQAHQAVQPAGPSRFAARLHALRNQSATLLEPNQQPASTGSASAPTNAASARPAVLAVPSPPRGAAPAPAAVARPAGAARIVAASPAGSSQASAVAAPTATAAAAAEREDEERYFN